MVPLYEPEPRFLPGVSSVEGKLYMWGGRTIGFEKDLKDEMKGLANRIECFDPVDEVWRHFDTQGTPHPGLSYPACTSFGEHIYMYGGQPEIGEARRGVLSCLNVATLNWSQLSFEAADGPMKKTACGMVHFHEDKLILIGGYGYPNGPAKHGAALLKNGHLAWTNEIHIFDRILGLWSSPTIQGTRPPPLADFSLTRIDNHRALLFGGKQHDPEFNDLYLIDFQINTMEIRCTKIDQCDGEPWPEVRALHAACCLGYAGNLIYLLITGGIDRNNRVLKDLWLFNLSQKRWKEITLPIGILQRWGHSATAITQLPGLEDVIIFGGISESYVGWTIRHKDRCRIAETAIITFEQLESEWVQVGVANNSQRGTSDRVREKLRTDDEQRVKGFAHPTLKNLTLIEWKNSKGGEERFRVKQLICNKWWDLGCLVEIPASTLKAWETKYMRDPQVCIDSVLSHWLENPTFHYPLSWEGLYSLLEDVELGEVTVKLKQALSNAQ